MVGIGRDFTDVGHAVALMLGMVVASRFGRAARWSPVRCLLLIVGSSFGYLMLANSGLTLIGATWLGLTGAAIAEVVVGRRRGREEAPRADALSCGLTPGVA